MSKKNAAFYHLNRINHQLDQLITRLDPVDPAIFHLKPAEDKWSVIQVFNHLYASEALNLKYLKYKEKEGDSFDKQKLMPKIKLQIYLLALVFPIKYKAPAAISNPSNEDTIEQIVEKFATLRKEYEVFLDGKEESFFHVGSNKHPIIGRLNMKNMFRFYHGHTRHHEKQILRTLIAVSK